MWYKVDIEKLGLLVTPTFLRKSVLRAIISSLLSQVRTIYSEWKYKREEEQLFRLNHNGQVCYLRKALNDKCDIQLRRIKVLKGNKKVRNYIYTQPENKPYYLGEKYIHPSSNYADTGVDFIVEVPKSVYDEDFHQIKAWIEFFKEGVKTYEIVEV